MVALVEVYSGKQGSRKCQVHMCTIPLSSAFQSSNLMQKYMSAEIKYTESKEVTRDLLDRDKFLRHAITHRI